MMRSFSYFALIFMTLLVAPFAGAEEASPPSGVYKIAFTCLPEGVTTRPEPGVIPDAVDICVVNVDSSGLVHIAREGINIHPVWSQDGRTLLFSHDQGEISYTPKSFPDGTPPLTVPHNLDVYAIGWSERSLAQVTSNPENEYPIQAWDSPNQFLMAQTDFVRESSSLNAARTSLGVTLKMVPRPCLFSMDTKECSLLGDEASQASCPSLSLAMATGFSPNRSWMSLPGSLCPRDEDLTSTGYERPRGHLLINEAQDSLKLFYPDPSVCSVLDSTGGLALQDDGTPFAPPSWIQPSTDCHYFLSPDRQKLAYFNASGQVETRNLDGSAQMALTASGLSVGDALTWSPDGRYLIGHTLEGGPLMVIDTTVTDPNAAVRLVGLGKEPNWSPVPLPDFGASLAATPETSPTTVKDTKETAPASAKDTPEEAGGCALHR